MVDNRRRFACRFYVVPRELVRATQRPHQVLQNPDGALAHVQPQRCRRKRRCVTRCGGMIREAAQHKQGCQCYYPMGTTSHRVHFYPGMRWMRTACVGTRYLEVSTLPPDMIR